MNAEAQGIGEAGAVYSGAASSAGSLPSKKSIDSLNQLFQPNLKQGTGETPNSKETYGGAENETASLKKSIEAANQDCLQAQQKEKAGKLAEAQKLYSRSLATRRHYWGSNDISQVSILYKIAEIHQKLGNLKSAELCLQEAQRIQAKNIGPGAFEAVPILDQLAKLALIEKKFSEAESYYERILALHERKSGKDSPAALTARLNLIDAAISLEDYKEARSNLDAVHEIFTRLSANSQHQIPDEQKNQYLKQLDRYSIIQKGLNNLPESQIYNDRASALKTAK